MTKDLLGKEWQCDCIGCSIGNGEVTPPGGLITSTKNFVLHQDSEIPIKGFLIVASKKHISSISQLNEEEAEELFKLVYKARMAMNCIKDLKDICIIQEERAKHFHLWIMPKYQWMLDKFPNSLSTIRDMNKYAKENYKTEDNIKDILATVEELKKYFK